MAKKKVYDIIYSAVVKHLRTKQGNVTSLPNDDQIKKGMRKIFRQLKDGGYNPVSADKVIKTEDDLNAVLRNIKEKKNADIAVRQRAAEGIERVFDKMRRNIPLNPDDQAALQGSGFKTALDNFKGFEPKVIQGGKNLTMKTPGGEIPYMESPTQTIMQGGKKVPVKIPTDIKDDVLEAYDNISSNIVRGDTKYNADVLAPELARRRGLIDEVQEATDMPGKEYSKLYSEAYDFLTKLNFLNKPPRKPKAKGGLMSAVKKLFKKSKSKKSGDKIYGVGGEEIDVADLKKSLGLDKATDKKSMEDLEKKLQMIIGKERTKHAGGGLAAALVKLKKKFGKDIIQKGKAPKDKGGRKKLKQMFEDFNKRTKKEGGGVAYMLGEGGLAGYGPHEMNKQPGQPGPMGPTFETNDPKEALKEVLARMEGSGLLQAPLGGGFSFDTGIGSRRPIDAGISFNPQDPRFDFQAGIGVKDGEPSGGFQVRMPFADGGMSRRTFLKIMAALASFPVVGKLAKTTKVAKGVKPIVTPTAEMPAHFPKLVEKIIREGQVVKKDFVKKTGDVTTYKHPDRPDIELTIEGEGKRIQLDFETDQGMKGGYEFRQGDIIDEPTSPMRGKRSPGEFDQGEVKYRANQDGSYTKDFEEGIDTGTENLDEFAGVGKKETSKSKVNLPESDDFADGGLAGLLGE